MSLINHIPNEENMSVFYATGGWQTWTKPLDSAAFHFLVIGGGGGGGSGYYRSALGAGSGGGGGAAGGLYTAIIPSILIPDTLYVYTGFGGAGAAGVTSPDPSNGNNGSPGEISYVSLLPEATAGSVLIQSSATVAGGGGGGPAGAGTTVGTAITLSTVGNFRWIGIQGTNTLQTAAGAGALGATSVLPGGNVTWAGLLTGGAGGGNTRTAIAGGGAGGVQNLTNISSVLGTGNFSTSTVPSGSFTNVAGQDGYNGFFIWNPFISIGGSGGGGGGNANVSAGGRGGDGAYGCGGGGGGATKLAGGGAGGNGGDGLIVITSL